MAVKRYNGTNWEVEAGSQGIVYSATAPTVPAVGDIWVSTQDIFSFDNTVQVAFRNVLINGGFAIDQRNSGASQTFTAAAALAYTVDRWYGYCTGANITGARVAGVAPSQYYYRFTGATSNTGVGFGQRIEANNSFHLAGQLASLSVNLASTSLTSITWTAFYANTTDTFGTLASPTRTLIATGAFAVTSTLGRKNVTFAVPVEATTGIEIVFTGGALLGSQTLTFGGVQLELGSTATPFETRPIGTELALCQRYYLAVTFAETSTLCSGHVQTGVTNRFTLPTPVSMRQASTITHNFGVLQSLGTTNQAFTIGSGYTSSNSIVIEGTVPAGQTAPLILYASPGTLRINAEL